MSRVSPWRCLVASALLLSISFSSLVHAQKQHPAHTVTDSLGQHRLPDIPKRPVVLGWDLIEQVIELGVTPVGITNKRAYQTWVVKPAIAKETVSVGTRFEPNLEAIASLHPDVIIIGEIQRDLKPQLSRIAPVLVYTNFKQSQQHAQRALATFRQLAHVFAKEQHLAMKMKQLNDGFTQLKARLVAHFGTPLPKVAVMRFINTTAVSLSAENSLPTWVIKRLGLTPLLTQKAAPWGSVRQPITQLRHVKQGYVLYLRPFYQEKALQHSLLYQALAVVKAHHVLPVRPVWNYGGAMSLLYMGQAITDSLLQEKSS